MKKYEFTGEVKVVFGITLKQIKRISNGEVGGWIEKEENLSQVSGDAWVFGNARVYGDAQVKKFDDLINVTNLQFNLTVTPKSASIGCHLKTHSEWLKVTKKEAVEMGLKESDYDFWKDLLTLLFARFI